MSALPITEPGLFDLTEAQYDADPVVAPSLRASDAWRLIAKGSTPANVAHSNIRINPAFVDVREPKFDPGKAAHKLMLGKGPEIVVCDFSDWRTNDAKRERAAAYAKGHIPLLPDEYAQAQEMADYGKRQLMEIVENGVFLGGHPFEGGQPEMTLVVRLNGVWCRCRLDYLQEFAEDLTDYKSTGASADPKLWEFRQMRPMGFHFKMAFYRACIREAIRLKIIDGSHSPNCVFIVQENYAPYLLSAVAVEDGWMNALETKHVPRALKIWRDGLATGVWKGYAADLHHAERTSREMLEDGEILMTPGAKHDPSGMGWSDSVPDTEFSGITFKGAK